MKLDRLHLTNFRRFAELQVELDDSFTLLVGENASGKTSLLDAAAVAIGGFLLGISATGSRSIRPEEVRYVRFRQNGSVHEETQWPARIAAEGMLAGTSVAWSRSLNGPRSKTTRLGATALIERAKELAVRVRAGEKDPLPVLAYYGTQRLWLELKSTEAKRGVGSRFDGYIDCMKPASSHRQLTEWLYQQTLAELQEKTPVLAMEAVETAVCRAIAGISRFYFDIRDQEILLQWEDGRIEPFSALSDGYRNMVAMVADLAWRAVALNPATGRDAAEQAHGIVLIDELDQHLHPRWQRRVVADLRRTFPSIQFVATTHSPQVVASASRQQVRLLAHGAAGDAGFVEGRDSNSLLEDLFGTPERPWWTQEQLDKLFRLIDEESYPEASSLQKALEKTLGPDDSAMVRARWILEREADLNEV